MRRRKASRGITLIEVMVALALSALMLTALVGVLKGFRIQEQTAESLQTERWPPKFVNLLYRDLLVCDGVFASNKTVWLTGNLPAYADSNQNGRRRIGYRIVETGGGETAPVRINGPYRQLIALRASRIVVERVDDQGVAKPLPFARGPVPQRVRVWVWHSGRAIVEQDITLQIG